MAASIEVGQDNTEQVQNGIKNALLQALEIVGSKAERYAKEKCPVDTGNLRNSITHAVVEEEKAVYIGTNVEYAPYVELGTGSYYPGGSPIKGMKARPYLKPAATEHSDEYDKIFKNTMKNG